MSKYITIFIVSSALISISLTIWIISFYRYPSASKPSTTSVEVPKLANDKDNYIPPVPSYYKAQSVFTYNLLSDDIKEYLSSQPGDWGVVVTDLKSGNTLNINETVQFHGASTTKVLSAIAALLKVETGEYTLDNLIYRGHTLRDILYLILNRSDNETWDYLNFKMGFDYLQNVGESVGMHSWKANENKVSALDLNNMLYNLYTGNILNEVNKNIILLNMQNTIIENRIPSGVPAEVNVYHKIGTYSTSIHDIGIIEASNPYILVVLGKNTTLASGTQTISEISKMIYEAVN